MKILVQVRAATCLALAQLAAIGGAADVDRLAKLEAEFRRPVGLNIVFATDPGAGKYDGVVGRSNDVWNHVDVGQTEIKSLRSCTGASSGVKLAVSENDGEWGIKGHAGIFHGYIYHNNRSVDLTARISGLKPGRYSVYVYAHGDAPDQNAKVELAVGEKVIGSKATVNDGSWRFREQKFAEGNQYVRFEVVLHKPDDLKITSRRDGSSYSMFNAIQIVPAR